MIDNTIILPGINNARELGGYPAGDRVVKKGVLIRSGSLNKAGPEAVALLSERYRVKTIIDFRMGSVIDGNPDAEVPGAGNIRLPVVEMEDFIARAKPELVKAYMADKTDKMAMFDLEYESGLLSPEMYLIFLLGERGKKAYREFFRILLAHDPGAGALLWHCEDGKDRAGLAAMLLLTALGSDNETIMGDYLLTNAANSARLEKIRKDVESYGMPPDKVESLLFVSGGVFERYMTYAIDALEKRYGSVAGYLSEELGLTGADIRLLREKYTTDK